MILPSLSALLALAAPVQIDVAVGDGATVPPSRVGVFFEDINFGADGGLSAELVKNGSFEFPQASMGWAGVSPIERSAPRFANNPNYVRMRATGGETSLTNEGYRGMGFRKGGRYRLSFAGRVVEGTEQSLDVELLNERGEVVGRTRVAVRPGGWKSSDVIVSSGADVAKGKLRLRLAGVGTVDLDAVSLMPTDTWKGRPNGLRADLVQKLADLKPGFVRFPGGCIVEGRDLANRYRWKDTIGPVEERKPLLNRWNVEFARSGRGAEDYYQSFRVGFFEYFQLCEDIGAAPLPIVNCGMACQYNSGECAPLDDMQSYLQDALDLVEFANGPATSPWGRRRAQMGHPRPFGMKAIGIGNEQWGPRYFERYEIFARAFREKHPEIQLVMAGGPRPDGAEFDLAWQKARELPTDLVDEHCYAPPAWFLDNAGRYDAYDRKGPKVFMGEYAAHPGGTGAERNVWEAAVAEAAFLTGMERNSDVVTMSSYAPLFANVDAWQWAPDLIWFDSRSSYGTPSYVVQRLFSQYRGDAVLPTSVAGSPTAPNGKPRFFASATRNARRGEVLLKVVNATANPVPSEIRLPGKVSGVGTALEIVAPLTARNDFDRTAIAFPVGEKLTLSGTTVARTFPANSVTVLRIPVGWKATRRP